MFGQICRAEKALTVPLRLFILKTAVESGIPRRLRLKSWVIRSAEGVPAGTVTAFHGETPQKCD